MCDSFSAQVCDGLLIKKGGENKKAKITERNIS